MRSGRLPSPPASDGSKTWDSPTPSWTSSPERDARPLPAQENVGNCLAIPATSGVVGGLGLRSIRNGSLGASTERLQVTPVRTADIPVTAGSSSFATSGTAPNLGSSVSITAGQSPRGPQQLLQRLVAIESRFNCEDWARHAQEAGKTSEEQVQELLQVIRKQQQAHKEVVELFRSVVRDGNSVSSVHRLGSSCGSQLTGSANTGLGGYQNATRPPSCASVEGPSTRIASTPLVWHSQGNSIQYTVGSPRRVVGEAKCLPVRQFSDFGDGNRTMTSQGSTETFKPFGESPLSNDLPNSPLTRSRSANFSTGPTLSAVSRGALVLPGSEPVVLPMSPQVPPRDASPPRSRSVIQGANPSFSMQNVAQQRGLATSYPSGPALPPALLQGFPPAVHVPAPNNSSNPPMPSDVYPSPRRGSNGGLRSPPPAPPGGHVPPYPKQVDRTPQSARSGGASGPSIQQSTGQDFKHQSESSSMGLRWEQASPYRVRYVNTNGSSSNARAAVNIGHVGTNRSVLGPPPMAAFSNSLAGTQPQPRPLTATIGQTLHMAPKTSPAVSVPTQW